jgi:hypothetical protein
VGAESEGRVSKKRRRRGPPASGTTSAAGLRTDAVDQESDRQMSQDDGNEELVPATENASGEASPDDGGDGFEDDGIGDDGDEPEGFDDDDDEGQTEGFDGDNEDEGEGEETGEGGAPDAMGASDEEGRTRPASGRRRPSSARPSTARPTSAAQRSPSPRRRTSTQAPARGRWGSQASTKQPSASRSRRPVILDSEGSTVQQPPVLAALAAGLRAVGTSVPVLVLTFVSVLLIWGGYALYGVGLAASPSAMVLFISLPPVHSLLDIQFLASGRVVAPWVTVLFGLGLVVLRAAFLTMWLSLILESLAGRRGREAFRGATARARRTFLPMVGVEGAYLAMSVIALYVVAGFLGQLGFLAALLGGVFFLIYAPVVVVAEGIRLRGVAQLSLRAARLPGPRQVLMAFSYVALTLLLAVGTPGNRVASATPSIAVWSYVLFVSFLHVSALAAFAYRWLLVREPVMASVPGSAVQGFRGDALKPASPAGEPGDGRAAQPESAAATAGATARISSGRPPTRGAKATSATSKGAKPGAGSAASSKTSSGKDGASSGTAKRPGASTGTRGSSSSSGTFPAPRKRKKRSR